MSRFTNREFRQTARELSHFVHVAHAGLIASNPKHILVSQCSNAMQFLNLLSGMWMSQQPDAAPLRGHFRQELHEYGRFLYGLIRFVESSTPNSSFMASREFVAKFPSMIVTFDGRISWDEFMASQLATRAKTFRIAINRQMREQIVFDRQSSPGSDKENIGEGSFGVVSEARVSSSASNGLPLKGKVAIKSVSKASDEVVRSEMAIASRSYNPFIVASFSLVNRSLIMMEFMCGGTLLDSKDSKLSVSQITQYAYHVALGMWYLHQHSVCHRDIKPENVLIRRGVAKLADFGFSKQFEGGLMLLSTRDIDGTLWYLPPEVLQAYKDPQKKGNYSFRSDVYAWAITFIESLVNFDYFNVFFNLPKKLCNSEEAEQTQIFTDYVFDKERFGLTVSDLVPLAFRELLLSAGAWDVKERACTTDVVNGMAALPEAKSVRSPLKDSTVSCANCCR